jgi:Putative polyhydroxyalkanoic acid system protein (PHA_gran_rgn)
MPLISVTVAHGQTADEAQRRLETVVQDASTRLGLRRVQWSDDRRHATLEGLGARVEVSVDAEVVRLTGDLPGVGALLAGPVIAGLKQMIERTFRKPLP